MCGNIFRLFHDGNNCPLLSGNIQKFVRGELDLQLSKKFPATPSSPLPPKTEKKIICIAIIQLDLYKCQLVATTAEKGVSFTDLLIYWTTFLPFMIPVMEHAACQALCPSKLRSFHHLDPYHCTFFFFSQFHFFGGRVGERYDLRQLSMSEVNGLMISNYSCRYQLQLCVRKNLKGFGSILSYTFWEQSQVRWIIILNCSIY